jgi:hypothetical protein
MSGARAYFAGTSALIGFAIAYALPIYARLPHAFYDPIARRWLWTRVAGPIPMGYVGQLEWGVAGAVLAGALAAALVRREPSERAYGLFAAWALTAIAIVIGYFTWNNWP